jgi:mono/diheme cytochrome c family protein
MVMRTWVRWVARIIFLLIGAVSIFFGYVYWRSGAMLAQRIEVDEPALSIPADADAVARGERLAITRGCPECHGTDLGGKIVMDEAPVGRLSAPNLTRGKGGVGARLDAASIEHAIRHGVGAEGRILLFMPASDYAGLTDADAADIIAYVLARPAVNREMPAAKYGPVLRGLSVLGRLPLPDALRIDQHAKHATAMEAAPTAEYGAYVSRACVGCHGENFSGGPIPGLPPSFPPAQNITPDTTTGIGKWTKADFYTALREGKRPDGTTINPFMPWKAFAKMSDTELDAVWAFLQGRPARAAGGR